MAEQPIKRNRYFDPPSTECSFNGETYDQDLQNFHLLSAQTQLASLHNWGIVQGLEVSGTLGSNTITINEGVALDAQGKLIVLATEGRGDLGTNPPGNNHDLVPVPVEFNTSSLAATSYYLTIQFSEYTNYNDPGSDICGRLEQAPWLRLQPVSGFTEDDTAMVLAVVTLDSAGNIVALAHQDSSSPVTRHLSSKTVGQLQIRRSQIDGNKIQETDAGTLEALASGGLQLSVTNPSDQILLNQIDGSNFSSLSVQADTLTTSGSLGIGTATPTAKLEVTGDLRLEAGVAVNEFSSDGTFSSNSELAVPTERAVKTYADGEIATVNNTFNTALSTKAALNGSTTQDFQTRNLTVNGNLTTTGSLDLGGDLRLRGADIRDVGGTSRISITDNGSLELKEDNGATALTIATNGNVGIATVNPEARLDVAGTLKFSNRGTLIFNGTNESGTPNGDGFRLRYDNNFFNTNQDALVIEKTDGNNPNPDGGIAFVNTGNDGVVETALVIRGNGNVGIGTNSPSRRLEVNGGVRINGDLNITGNISGRLAGLGVASASSLSHGQSIPVPEGFTRDECLFFATIKFLNFRSGEDILVNCSADADGKITATPEGQVAAKGYAIAQKGGW